MAGQNTSSPTNTVFPNNSALLTPDEAVAGVLAITRALQEHQKLTPELVQTKMNIVLKKNTNEPGSYGYRGKNIKEQWQYLYDIKIKKNNVFSIDFLYRSLEGQPLQLKGLCNSNVDHIHNELMTMGFSNTSEMTVLGLSREYYSDVFYIMIVFADKHIEHPENACLQDFYIRERIQ